MATDKTEDVADGSVSLVQKMMSATTGSVLTSLLGTFTAASISIYSFLCSILLRNIATSVLESPHVTAHVLSRAEALNYGWTKADWNSNPSRRCQSTPPVSGVYSQSSDDRVAHSRRSHNTISRFAPESWNIRLL